jgi:hypothetical protein
MPIPSREPDQPKAIRLVSGGSAKVPAATLRKRTSAIATSILLLTLEFSAGLPAGVAQTTKSSKATVREILDRQELFINRRRAKVKDTAQQPESLKTLKCRAQLAFADGAGGRMIKESTIRLGDCLFISQGSVLVSGPMCACSQSVKVCSANTNYIFEVIDGGDAAVTSLEGTLDVQFLESDLPPSGPGMVVNSGQRLRVYQDQGFTTIINLTADNYARIIEGPFFKGFRERLPNQGALEDYLNEHVPGVSLPKPEPERSVNQSGPPLFFLPLLLDFRRRPGVRQDPTRSDDRSRYEGRDSTRN